MARRIPERIIEEIRAANDIVDVIAERIPVKRAGRNFRALCPFHDEKTPSFNINPERQIYHCFGCGVGGNAITFVMEYDKIGFVEAVQELAARAGIQLPDSASDVSEEGDPIFAANALALRYFRETLAGRDGEAAREYWKGRGVSSEATESFRIGYAPPGWDGLLSLAQKEGIGPQHLEDAGLVIRRERGGFYDRFRDRVIFPLLWTGGRTVGFGGRALGDQEPKYLNSPETRVYHKGQYLYGLAQARLALRSSREAVLVEGYMDLLALWDGGFHNVVASAGTALTPEQARIIERYADRVFVAYDGDSAGRAAAVRAAELLVRHGLKVRVVSFPEGSDPDAFVRSKGPDALAERLAGASDFIDFLLLVNPPDTPERRESAARELLDTVAGIDDPIKADLMLEKIAEALSIDRGALTRALDGRRASAVRRAAAGSAGPSAGKDRGGPGDSALVAAQKGLLALLLEAGPEAGRVRQEVALDDFTEPVLRSLAERLLAAEGGGDRDVGSLLSRASVEEAAVLTEICITETDEDNGRRVCDDYIRTVRRARIEAQIEAVDRQIETAEMTGDEEKLLSQVAARQELARRLKELAAGS
ncbi:MAG: DNA primase [Candidatus Eisenbacteria bacterium]|nr:DNA primase [Candidatus Eisenbacteria bacterium]